VRALLALLLLIGCGCSDSTAHEPKAEAVFGLTANGRVVDAANLLDDQAEQRLSRRASELEKATRDQLIVVTVPTLEGRTIEQTSLHLGNGWGVGREDLDNGVLLLVAPKEKKVRIEVGRGLEGLLSDRRAAAIIKRMLPSFRAGDMTGAIELGAKDIDALLRSDVRRPQYGSRTEKQAA
jgi:uncharacterized protein